MKNGTFFALCLVAAATAAACGGSSNSADDSTGAGGANAGGSNAGGSASGDQTPPPCDVQKVFAASCTSCHGAPPLDGVPASLVTRADLLAPGPDGKTMAEYSLDRMKGMPSQMPPKPAAAVTDAEIATVQAWIDSGYAGDACDPNSVKDPLNNPVGCESGTHWTGGNKESPDMNPGEACIACHKKMEPFKINLHFSVAGTVYPSGHEDPKCNGVNGKKTTGVQIVITDANGTDTTIPVSLASGNFYKIIGGFKTPYTAKVVYDGKERKMLTPQTDGDCNTCHTQDGTMMAPGRITLPY